MLADERYPEAQKIRLVQDNLNTHRLANLYLGFPPAEASRLAERFELHYTPPHGSWLNMAEIEIGIFERGCLRRRVTALETERNAAHATMIGASPPAMHANGLFDSIRNSIRRKTILSLIAIRTDH
jgi:hypothetical protein